MNLLFLSMLSISSIKCSGIYTDLLREFVKNGDCVYILSSSENMGVRDSIFFEESKVQIVKVRAGRIQKTNIIQKGLNMVLIDSRFKKAIKKYFFNVHFDLVLYTTPPITLVNVVRYIKTRDNARTYLMLKDIFPQNAVDIGMMSTTGITGLLYKYFRRKEKKLYAVSDRIGCMSQANIDYVISHNPEIPIDKLELCPNSIEVQDFIITETERIKIRKEYGLPLKKKIFVYGGNLGKPQGVPFLIDCLKTQLENPDVFFLIVGNGTEYGKLQAFFSEENPSNMKLMSSILHEDYDRMITACDVGLIFLDHRFTIPNFPSRLLSYMQAKLPVLACTDSSTDIGKVIVDGKFGWWCESNDIYGFRKKIELIINMQLEEKGKKGFEYLCQYYTTQNTYINIMKDKYISYGKNQDNL